MPYIKMVVTVGTTEPAINQLLYFEVIASDAGAAEKIIWEEKNKQFNILEVKEVVDEVY